MASWYRKVDVRMWGDLKFRSLTSRGQFLWFRLLTGPETTAMPGVIPVGKATLAEALGWSQDDIGAAFAELVRQRMVMVDFDARLVFLPRALRYNPPAAPNVVISWRATFDALPECELKTEIIRTFAEGMESYSDGFRHAFRKAFAKTYPIQDQDQDQDQEQKQEGERRLPPPSPTGRSQRGQTIPLLPPSTEPAKKARGTRLPVGWQPSAELLTDLRETFRVEPLGCLDAFKDWAASSPRAVKLDWDATFRSWVRREASEGKLEPWEPKASQLGMTTPKLSDEQKAANQRRLSDAMSKLEAKSGLRGAFKGPEKF